MEFPDLGQKCSWSLCNIHDFLPLTCSYCKRIFCKDHFNRDTHECSLLRRDIEDCTDISTYVCTSEGCSSCSPLEMLCPKCKKHFCLTHRYHDCFDIVDDIEAKKRAWNQPKEQFEESLKCVNDAINDKIKKAIQNPKKQEVALKIQLMRLKGKAEGCASVPETDRIFFLIVLPKESTKPPKPIFVSKDWSVGKVIDSVASICKIVNNNNVMQAPKLRLFKLSDGNQISSDTSAKITDLIGKKKINNGETLILEYISAEEDVGKYKLENFLQYNDFLCKVPWKSN